MSPRRNYAIVMLGILVLLSFSIADVRAHSPSNMVLEYNAATQELSVQVSHSVADPLTHYIQEILVLKNDIEVDSETYTSQTSASGMSETFIVAAVEGDVLKVTATCSVAGSITRQIVVTADTSSTSTTVTTTSSLTTSTSTTGTTGDTITDSPWLLGSVLILAAIAIVLVIAVARRML